jgi:hypothetical protein
MWNYMQLAGTDKYSARWPLNNAHKISKTGYPAGRKNVLPTPIGRSLDGHGRGSAQPRNAAAQRLRQRQVTLG